MTTVSNTVATEPLSPPTVGPVTGSVSQTPSAAPTVSAPANIDAATAKRCQVIAAEFDSEHYLAQKPDLSETKDLVLHYLWFGAAARLDPHPKFSTKFYFDKYPDIEKTGINPYFHYLIQGRKENRQTAPSAVFLSSAQSKNMPPTSGQDLYVYQTIQKNMDVAFYQTHYPDVGEEDPALHYMHTGWKKNFDPSPEFSTKYYLKLNPDIKEAGVNPYYHYLVQGVRENRKARRSELAVGGKKITMLQQHQANCAPGPWYENFDATIAANNPPRVKALVFYLSQFHAIPENDRWWGDGFTEWRNTSRGVPRYAGHQQPRIPRDLGFYDLTDIKIMARQAAMAQAAGVHGFVFYYYHFNGKRLLEKPVENFLQNSDINMPFMLMWANENWTRNWDGFENDVLMAQDYHDADEDNLLADLARHFADRRYIRVQNRPLFVIYRPSVIPNGSERFARWRKKWHQQHGVQPLLYMAQGFNDLDPTAYGLDGALEFPPHKVAAGLPPVNAELDLLDEDFSGNVLEYQSMVDRSCNEPMPPFPLIKGVTLNWDNEARRPGKGMSFRGATPRRYEKWLRTLVQMAQNHPSHGESFVAINAWNEWAEGTYLEPDVHFGAAFLNATARALCGVAAVPVEGRRKVLLVGHDAHRHGAQILLYHIGQTLTKQFNVAVRFLLLDQGPMLETYRALAPCEVISAKETQQLDNYLASLRADDFDLAITNTAVSGKAIAAIQEKNFHTVALIHELPTLLNEYGLKQACNDIASCANHVVFPATVVRDGFLNLTTTNKLQAVDHIRPQGLYNKQLLKNTLSQTDARKKLNIPVDAHVIINVGFADFRKGFDIFINVANALIPHDPQAYFVWVGAAAKDMERWVVPDIKNGLLNNRFVLTGFVDNVDDYYAAADLFFISSREDPFPSVVLEALQAGLPVVGFEGSGGSVEICRKYGAVVDRGNTQAIVQTILHHLQTPVEQQQLAAQARRQAVAKHFQFDAYCAELLQILDPKLKTVSVVVPNYNYAACLQQRLDSIFSQSYPVFEIIVLDDASQDNSVAVINQHATVKQREISLHVNSQNSGSVFKQWLKGAHQARGEYLWIAEADDVSDPLFLYRLLDALEKTSGAALAFCDSWQIDTQGDVIGESYQPYVNGGEYGPFSQPFSLPGQEFLRRHLLVKNVILNVSSVVWRRQVFLDAASQLGEELFNYKVAGDWVLYIQACQTNRPVAYVSDALNGHRRHASSVTHVLNKRRHYDEIKQAQQKIADVFKLSDREINAQLSYLQTVGDVLGIFQE